MGKWATYRHRGGVTVPAPTLPMSAPVNETNFSIDQGTGNQLHYNNLLTPGPAGAIDFTYSLVGPAGPWLAAGPLIEGDDEVVLGVGAGTDTWTRARYCVSFADLTPLSPWCTPVFFHVPD